MDFLAAELNRRLEGLVHRAERLRPFTFDDLIIVDKHQKKRRFNPAMFNYGQQSLAAKVPLTGFSGLREVLVKPRQIGSSTFWAMLYFLDTINNSDTQTVIIAQEAATAQKLLGMMKTAYEHLSPDLEPPQTKLNNSTTLEFTNGSAIHALTAKNYSVGRGYTVKNFLGTEVAYWENPSQIQGGIKESVPLHGNLVYESTAKIVGDFFHELYQTAKAGESSYRPWFFPWYHFPEYQVSSPDLVPEHSVKFGDELRLIELYGLTQDQLGFRRLKIQEAVFNGIKKFQCEYPSNDIEAFQTEGATLFDGDALNAMASYCTESKFVPMQLGLGIGTFTITKIDAHISELPKSNTTYLIACDPGGGLNSDGLTDYHTIIVMDVDQLKVVASFQNQTWNHDQLAELLVQLHLKYNRCQVIIERNNHGHAVINSYVRILGAGTTSLYEFHDYKTARRQARGNQGNSNRGFLATAASVTSAVSALKAKIDEMAFIIPDGRIINELRHYQNMPGGKFGTLPGKHDDFVSSLRMLAYVIQNLQVQAARIATPKKRRVYSGGGWFSP